MDALTPFELSVRFFLQLAVILVVCRLVSALARRIGQPTVIGEMIAGVILGPSLFGAWLPEIQAWLFPVSSRPILFTGAQLGLTLYMFTVGLDFQLDQARQRWHSAMAISVSGIVVPFALGCAVALPLIAAGGYFTPSLDPLAAMPYLGAAMAITAFPTLARIIAERRLTGTTEGTLALAAGAIGDAVAWCILALVLAGVSGEPSHAVWALGGGAAFLLVLRLGRSWLGRLERSAETDFATTLGTVLTLLILAAWFTDLIGLYAVFGAFFLGAAMPRGPLVVRLRETTEPLTSRLLLPLFFVYSGLNTRIDLLNDAGLWLVAAIVLAVAIVGKTGACALAARLSGEPTRIALAIGMLMNARGLMELIILNIGLERGLITPTLFTIMVLMALVTTLMATPLLDLVQRAARPASARSELTSSCRSG